MACYDINGISTDILYDEVGNQLTQAYDIDGQELLNGIITVMTFNVQGWTGMNANTALISSIFNAYQPILFCGVQEPSGYPTYIGTQFQRGIPPEKVVFMLNTQYSDYSKTVFSTIAGNRNASYHKCYITVNDKTIAIYSVHLEPYDLTVRVAQMQELLDEIEKEDYFIAVGDYNCCSEVINDTEYTRLIQPVIDAGYNLANWTTETGLVWTWFNGTTVEGSSWVCPCDNIITSTNIDIVEVFYDQRKIDANTGQTIDHIPVIARLKIN